jgi:AraC-like DNA-binding protein
MFKTTTICVFLLGIFSLPVFAQSADTGNEVKRAIDSLYALLHRASDEAKAEIYKEIEIKYRLNDNFEEQVAFFDEYLRYLRKRKNIQGEGIARVQLACVYSNSGHWEEYLPQLPDDLAFWEKHELWDNYFYVTELKIEKLLFNNLHETALAEAQKAYTFAQKITFDSGKGTALISMGAAYHSLHRYADARKCFREAFDLLKNKSTHSDMAFTAINYLCESFTTGEYQDALPVLAEWEAYIIEQDKKNPPIRIPEWMNYYMTCARIYKSLGRLQQSEEVLRKADELIYGTSEVAVFMIKRGWIELYIAQAKYDMALHLCDSLLTHLDLEESYITDMLKAKAEIADSMGNTALASVVYHQLYLRSDSLDQVEMAAKLDEMRTLHEVDKLTLEKERNRNYLYFSLAGFGLSLITLSVWIVYSRRLRAKNKEMVIHILEQDQLMKALPAYANWPGSMRAEKDLLLQRLAHLMKDPTVFTDPLLNRKSLAEKLNTNETALQELITRYFSCSVTEYINEQRLNYARTLLACQSEKYTIEAIAVDSGFGTRRTFYRQFQQRYSLTPGEYRRAASTYEQENA